MREVGHGCRSHLSLQQRTTPVAWKLVRGGRVLKRLLAMEISRSRARHRKWNGDLWFPKHRLLQGFRRCLNSGWGLARFSNVHYRYESRRVAISCALIFMQKFVKYILKCLYLLYILYSRGGFTLFARLVQYVCVCVWVIYKNHGGKTWVLKFDN